MTQGIKMNYMVFIILHLYMRHFMNLFAFPENLACKHTSSGAIIPKLDFCFRESKF